MLKFAKIFRKKKDDPELANNEGQETTLLEQDSEEQFYGPPSAREGQVSIHFTGVSPASGGLLVGFFVSNGLSKKVKFEEVPLVLRDSTGRILARQSFAGDLIGEVDGGSSKACVVRFRSNNVYSREISGECQVCFDIPKPSQSSQIQYQTLPEDMTESQRQELERILRELPPIQQGEVNLSPLNSQITPQGDLLATVIIRNGTDKLVNMEQLPMAVFDAQRQEVARGLFNIKDLAIKPFKALLWSFNFGAVSQDRELDLSRWHINIVQ